MNLGPRLLELNVGFFVLSALIMGFTKKFLIKFNFKVTISSDQSFQYFDLIF